GNAWRNRWDSLRLFTPAVYCGLPGMPFPAAPWHLPDKDETADYLERYAQRFELPIRLGTRVEWVWRDGDRFVVRAGSTRLEADQVIIATGPFQRPWIPDVSARLSPSITQIHSSQYRNPFELPDGPTLVVGVGNSGAQIALELARTRKVWLAGKETGHLPRRFFGRDVFAWLWPHFTRFTVETRFGRHIRTRLEKGDPLIGISPRHLKEAGVQRVGRVDDEIGGLPVCEGELIQPEVVVWCTGFRSDYHWIDPAALDHEGQPLHRRGVSTTLPGLYFVGLPFQHRRTSALIGGVGEDAAFIAEHVRRRVGLEA
ncbi:MAG TPA: NAD(P)-binding domain-containing protein, partial [Rhodothermales bacterium]